MGDGTRTAACRLPAGTLADRTAGVVPFTPVEAMAALVDNAYQARAGNVVVTVDKDDGGRPVRLTVSDDGCGMDPDRIRTSVTWGGTHRPDDRSGLGRFGFGMPAALSAFGRTWRVVSVVGEPYALEVDVSAGDGNYVVVDEPTLVTDGSVDVARGTVVSVEIDRPVDLPPHDDVTTELGMTLGRLGFDVDLTYDDGTADARIRPVDPLFVAPGTLHADLSPAPASVGAFRFAIPVTEGVPPGTVDVRVACLPVPLDSDDPRLALAKRFDGIVVSRFGRVVDVIDPGPLHDGPLDPRIRVEVAFPPTVDEAFGVDLGKRVRPTAKTWDRMAGCGAKEALAEATRRIRTFDATLRDSGTGRTRPSERAVGGRGGTAGGRIGVEEIANGPAFRVEWDDRRVVVNKDSSFYRDLCAGPDTDPSIRDAIETMLLTAVDSMEGKRPDVRAFDVDVWARRMEATVRELARENGAPHVPTGPVM